MNRRNFLRTTGTAAAVLGAGWPVHAQTLRKIKYTNPWVPEGSSVFSYVARNKGIWRKRGLDVEVARGFGSMAATQAVGAGQFDFGYAASPAAVLQMAKGLPLTMIGQIEYVPSMGVGVLVDSPIRKPKDLEGKTMGSTPTSGDYPFLGAFAKSAGFDLSKVKVVHMDNQVRERALLEKQVDAISGFASSTIPQVKSRGVDVRYMLMSSYGMKMYSLGLITQRKILKEDPALVEAFVDGTLEAVAWTIKNQEEALDVFLQEIAELKMTSSGRDYTKIGLGIHTYITLVDEVKTHGFGWADPKVVEAMIDLVMDNVVKTDGKRPTLAEAFTNKFAGKYRLTDAEWTKATRDSAEWGKYLT